VAAAGPPAETLVPEVIRRVYGVDSLRIEGAVPAVILRPAGAPG
jgi:ABC-type cobalamin/Fe3+-siderophores transport system ATPase subunit